VQQHRHDSVKEQQKALNAKLRAAITLRTTDELPCNPAVLSENGPIRSCYFGSHTLREIRTAGFVRGESWLAMMDDLNAHDRAKEDLRPKQFSSTKLARTLISPVTSH
jgi:hypothetical protein